MIQAEPHLWDNLVTSLGTRIKKFKNKSFPLYDLLGELYDRHTTDGKFNFTSTSDVTQIESDGQFQAEEEMEKEVAENEEDLQMLDKVEVEHRLVNDRRVVDDGDQMRVEVVHQQVNARRIAGDGAQRRVVGGLRKKPKNSPKSSGDGLIGLMNRFVGIKEKESQKEDAQDFSITKCITVLKKLEGVTTADKILASKVFKSADNREFFISVADDEDGTALT